MKIKCPNCKYILDIENGYKEYSTDIVICHNCNYEINISNIKEYNGKDDLEYINTNEWEKDKIIKIYTKSLRILFAGIILIVMGSFGVIQAIIYKLWMPNTSIYSIFLLAGIYTFTMYFIGELRFSIGKNSNVFMGLGKLGFKKKIDWNNITEIYRTQSLLKRYRKYFIILKGNKKYKINITWINENERDYLLNTLQNLRYQKKVKSTTSP